MKTIHLGIFLLLFMVLSSQTVFPQTTDSLSSSLTSGGAIQFQLIGGLGVYYIGDFGAGSHFRIGADISLNHSGQSGDANSYSIYTYTSPVSTNGYSSTRQPEETSTSYQISISGLYLHKLTQYNHTFIYCGAGPMVSYSWSRSTSKSRSTQNDGNNVSSYSNDNENTNKTSGIGPLAIFGVSSRLIEHVGLSAEIGLSAIYQWKTQSYSYSSTSSDSPSNTSTGKNGQISHFNGWEVSLNAIRIGLVVQL